jgi:hypothetical protein
MRGPGRDHLWDLGYTGARCPWVHPGHRYAPIPRAARVLGAQVYPGPGGTRDPALLGFWVFRFTRHPRQQDKSLMGHPSMSAALHFTLALPGIQAYTWDSARPGSRNVPGSAARPGPERGNLHDRLSGTPARRPTDLERNGPQVTIAEWHSNR